MSLLMALAISNVLHIYIKLPIETLTFVEHLTLNKPQQSNMIRIFIKPPINKIRLITYAISLISILYTD